MNETNTTRDILLDQRECLKIEKNTKGYNWEIKILARNVNDGMILPSDIGRLEELDKILQDKFGGFAI